MFIIVSKGAASAYHRIFATEALARESIARSTSAQQWTIYKLTEVATVKRSSDLVESKP